MVDTMMASNSINFSSSEQESSCDESVNSTQFDKEQRQDKHFYSSDEDNGLKWQTRQSIKRERLQTLRSNHSLEDDTRHKSTEKESECLRRLPTRRPNPNTFNRNAIMARENRRKKKEYVEKLENEIDTYKSENKKLRKMLKQQFKMVEKLSHEKDYLRSVLANKTQIMSLLNVIKHTNPQKDIAPPPSSLPRTAVTGLEDLTEPGTAPFPDPFLSSVRDINEFISADYDLSMVKFNESYLSNETDILGDPFAYTSFDYLSSSGDTNAAINDEHNYFRENSGSESGVCLHVSAGHLSLEFCVSCNDNAKSSWLKAN